ncbi:Pathoproteinsis-related protein 1 [Hibiscus syriacus]|uniref:Pathoproteinsis-related protein 1 n=1 Tax=Hibiscus syriacus TaxID=106335 RepID=A0A6A2YGZ5_HIBSY|nr:Pathoproteinsis-related protein 1 [Hibiscus syriacus]
MEFSLALSCLMAVALALVLPPMPKTRHKTNAHNAARAAVGVEPITWDDTVAAYAQIYASQRIADCNLVHSGGPYGENLAWSSSDLSGTDAVTMWVNEGADYDYGFNSCASGKAVHVTVTPIKCAWPPRSNFDQPRFKIGNRLDEIESKLLVPAVQFFSSFQAVVLVGLPHHHHLCTPRHRLLQTQPVTLLVAIDVRCAREKSAANQTPVAGTWGSPDHFTTRPGSHSVEEPSEAGAR